MCLIALQINHGIDSVVAPGEQSPAWMTKPVKSTGFDQRLHCSLVADLDWHLVEEVLERCEVALCLAGRNDPINNVLSNVAD